MYIESVPNRQSRPALLLRESWREAGKIKKRTLANLTDWPAMLVEHLRVLLHGGVALSSLDSVLQIERALPHGHVLAVLEVARACGLEKFTQSAPAPLRALVLALIAARLLEPASKLATWRQLSAPSATHSLSTVLALGEVTPERVYAALDWLGEQQSKIERTLARRHLTDGALVLYDLTSTWYTGRHCPLAKFGYSRDAKSSDPQIVIGLLCTAEGCPVAVEVFEGNTADSATLAAQLRKLKERFGLTHVVWVGDRGVLSSAKIDTLLRPQGLSWVTALRAAQIRTLAEDSGPWQTSWFDERGLIEVQHANYPGERLIVCRNPALAIERARKREALLAATETELAKIRQACARARQPLRGEAKIALRVGRVVGRYRMAKHFDLNIESERFSFTRKSSHIEAEAALDGMYVLRTNVPAERFSSTAVVNTYKSLATVERAFRSLKTVDLDVRPIYHRNPERVRAHVFLCMLAYYLEWHLRQALKPLLFDDEDLLAERAAKRNPVLPTPRSSGALRKKYTLTTDDGLPVHSLRTLLADLATLTYNVTHTAAHPEAKIILTSRPTALQAKAFKLLGVNPQRTQ